MQDDVAQDGGADIVFAVSLNIGVGGIGVQHVVDVGVAHRVVADQVLLLGDGLDQQRALGGLLNDRREIGGGLLHHRAVDQRKHLLQRHAIGAAHVDAVGLQEQVGEVFLHIGRDLRELGLLQQGLVGGLAHVVVADILAHIVAQLLDGAQVQVGVDVVCDPLVGQVRHVVQRGGKDRVLAGQVRVAVVGIGEGDLHVKGLAGGVAGDLVLEVVDKAAAAQLQDVILRGAAVKLLAVHRTHKVDADDIAHLGGTVGDLGGGCWRCTAGSA